MRSRLITVAFPEKVCRMPGDIFGIRVRKILDQVSIMSQFSEDQTFRLTGEFPHDHTFSKTCTDIAHSPDTQKFAKRSTYDQFFHFPCGWIEGKIQTDCKFTGMRFHIMIKFNGISSGGIDSRKSSMRWRSYHNALRCFIFCNRGVKLISTAFCTFRFIPLTFPPRLRRNTGIIFERKRKS